MLVLQTLFSIKKGCVKGEIRESLDFLLIGVVFSLFPRVLTTLNISGVINAYVEQGQISIWL